MNLYLLRHGVAVEREDWRGRHDAERPLTSEGRATLVRIGRAMAALELEFDVILTSPYVRARQTAEIVARQLGCPGRVELCEALVPDAGHRAAVRALQGRRPAPRNALLVGHEPGFSGLVSFLATGGAALDVAFKKGGLAALEVTRLRAGRCARLLWLCTPRQLMMLA